VHKAMGEGMTRYDDGNGVRDSGGNGQNVNAAKGAQHNGNDAHVGVDDAIV
jgi:hypothetical protein